MNVPVQRILAHIRQEFTRSLGDQLDALYVYGSQARGDARPDSDIDILAIVRGGVDYDDLIDRTSEVVSDLSLTYDVVISRAFVSRESFDHDQTPFLINVRREGVSV